MPSLIADDILIVIPARFHSTRLPGKPLIDISGKPMIVRTAEQCLEVASREQVIVATDDLRIAEVCRASGIGVEMTDSAHLTGSDRVAEVARRHSPKTVVNVQGDEPVFNPQDILTILEASREDNTKTFIGYCDLSEEEWQDSKNIKLTFGLNNQLLYIGRAQVPGSHSGTFHFGYRQVCIYVYSPSTLERFASVQARTPLEEIEDNEVVRFLELGMPVEVVKLSDKSISVDRPQDVDRVERRLSEQS